MLGLQGGAVLSGVFLALDIAPVLALCFQQETNGPTVAGHHAFVKFVFRQIERETLGVLNGLCHFGVAVDVSVDGRPIHPQNLCCDGFHAACLPDGRANAFDGVTVFICHGVVFLNLLFFAALGQHVVLQRIAQTAHGLHTAVTVAGERVASVAAYKHFCRENARKQVICCIDQFVSGVAWKLFIVQDFVFLQVTSSSSSAYQLISSFGSMMGSPLPTLRALARFISCRALPHSTMFLRK